MSKFKKLSDYISEPFNYKLLPFKFERLANDDYIVTNLTGDFCYLNSDQLNRAVDFQLTSDEPIYADLRAKHFIIDNHDKSPIELLSLKLRTKFSRLANFTNLHIFVVTLRCDHSCPYCQVSRQSEDKAAFDMTKEMADNALNFVFRSPSPALKIEFQGGEPLLNFELIKYIVLKAENKNVEFKRELAFVIATTLSLITDEILSFCKAHNIFLSSSLDGPEELHNSNRPRRDKNSHQKFVEGLSKARDFLGYYQVSALMTTTESSLPRVQDIIDEYLRLGFEGIFLRPLSPYGFAIKTKKYRAYDTQKWLEFYKEGLDYIIQLNKSGIKFSEHYTSLVLTKMMTSNEPGYVDLMNPAGLGIAAIVFNYDGSVYPSDESRMLAEMGDKSFLLGSILSNSYEEIMLSEPLLTALEDTFTLSVPMCSDCAFEPYCGAEPVYHHAIHKDLIARKPESEFCNRNMTTFKHILELMKDPEVKELFNGWANRC